MGVDVKAYGKATFIGDNRFCDNRKHFHLLDPHYVSNKEVMQMGCYEVDECTYEFKAGTSTNHSLWLNILALLIYGHPTKVIYNEKERYADLPFVAFFRGASPEVIFGPKLCAQLLKEFSDNRQFVTKAIVEKANAYIPKDSRDLNPEWWLYHYDDWCKAFTLASDNGLIQIY
jgi:hypothetical protein